MNSNEFVSKLEEYFVTNENEWVLVDITALNKIDIKLVSDKSIDIIEADKYINELFQQLGNNYSKGFIRCYSIEDAEILDIKKPYQDKKSISSLADLAKNYINPNPNIVRKKKKNACKIISFYSYKGGVGRTLALVETAFDLARRGKKVLILDLDIEAPSFQEVFKDELVNINSGIVDYLYDKLVNDNKTEISDIFEEIKTDDLMNGKLYAIPAGKLSASYVFKLSQLQTREISNNEYLEDLIYQLQKRLNIDIVLIDSRTGLNKWGAFSLLDLADNIIYFAYPNKENIFGLKLVIEMMKKANYDKMMVVFSRIEGKASDYAKELFEQLNYEQEYVPIYYNQDIAISNKYPVMSAMKTYEPITDYILEEQYSSIRTAYLKRKNSLKILQQLQSAGSKDLYTTISSESKIYNKDTKVVVIPSHMNDYIKRRKIFRIRSRSTIASILNETKAALDYCDIINDDNKSKQLIDYINKERKLEGISWKNIWQGYIIWLLNNIQNENKNLKETIEEISKMDENCLDNLIGGTIKHGVKSMSQPDIDENIRFLGEHYRVIILLTNTEWIHEVGDESKESLKSLINIILSIEEKTSSKIVIKFLLDEDIYQENISEFNVFKGSIDYLAWNKNDIKRLLYKFVKLIEDEVSDYTYCIKNNIYDDTVLINNIADYNKVENNEDKELRSRENNDELLSLFWGTRTKTNRYTKPMFDWFYENISKYREINDKLIQDILEKAIQYQITSGNKDNLDRLISLESLEKAFLD